MLKRVLALSFLVFGTVVNANPCTDFSGTWKGSCGSLIPEIDLEVQQKECSSLQFKMNGVDLAVYFNSVESLALPVSDCKPIIGLEWIDNTQVVMTSYGTCKFSEGERRFFVSGIGEGSSLKIQGLYGIEGQQETLNCEFHKK